MTKRNWAHIAVIAAAALLVGSCNNELSNSSSPIELVLSTAQTLQQLDLAGGANCDQTVATVTIQARQKNPAADPRFLDAHITSYRVTYRRTDGGTVVPPEFVRAIDLVIAPGGTSSDAIFHITDFGTIFNQAPFVSLLPQNGGVDAETKLPRIRFNVTLELFGQTIAGDRVSGSTTIPLDFCFDCQGCKP